MWMSNSLRPVRPSESKSQRKLVGSWTTHLANIEHRKIDRQSSTKDLDLIVENADGISEPLIKINKNDIPNSLIHLIPKVYHQLDDHSLGPSPSTSVTLDIQATAFFGLSGFLPSTHLHNQSQPVAICPVATLKVNMEHQHGHYPQKNMNFRTRMLGSRWDFSSAQWLGLGLGVTRPVLSTWLLDGQWGYEAMNKAQRKLL